jgi:hypothetical protein
MIGNITDGQSGFSLKTDSKSRAMNPCLNMHTFIVRCTHLSMVI